MVIGPNVSRQLATSSENLVTELCHQHLTFGHIGDQWVAILSPEDYWETTKSNGQSRTGTSTFQIHCPNQSSLHSHLLTTVVHNKFIMDSSILDRLPKFTFEGPSSQISKFKFNIVYTQSYMYLNDCLQATLKTHHIQLLANIFYTKIKWTWMLLSY